MARGEAIASITNELLELRNERGEKMGEWVGEKIILGSDGQPLVKLGDFVLYEGAHMAGRALFVVPEDRVPVLGGGARSQQSNIVQPDLSVRYSDTGMAEPQ
jgi:hypothetical protein